MNKKELIDLVESTSIYTSDKNEIIKAIIRPKDETKFEIEKYKIDKMIENGLIKEDTFDKHVKKDIINKATDTISTILTSGRFYLVVISILSFTLLLFNSHNYWKIRTIQETRDAR